MDLTDFAQKSVNGIFALTTLTAGASYLVGGAAAVSAGGLLATGAGILIGGTLAVQGGSYLLKKGWEFGLKKLADYRSGAARAKKVAQPVKANVATENLKQGETVFTASGWDLNQTHAAARDGRMGTISNGDAPQPAAAQAGATPQGSRPRKATQQAAASNAGAESQAAGGLPIVGASNQPGKISVNDPIVQYLLNKNKSQGASR
jgi:nitrogen fixation protein